MTCYLCDGELVCEKCAVDVTDDEIAIPGESDSPEHCSYCHVPLFEDFGLTSEGVEYVLESIRDDLRASANEEQLQRRQTWKWEHGYYVGMGFYAVGRDWAEYVLDNHHGLNKRDKRTLELFLYWTRNKD